ncbi:MAG: ferrochelatase, partial [Candidatus Thioglobus sp.]|nr:ferrochelatase [Candidatus Thioglobus sp.]
GYFIEAGGQTFSYIPALNDRDDHIKTLSSIIAQQL